MRGIAGLGWAGEGWGPSHAYPSSAFCREAAICLLSSPASPAPKRCFSRFSCSFFSLVACGYRTAKPVGNKSIPHLPFTQCSAARAAWHHSAPGSLPLSRHSALWPSSLSHPTNWSFPTPPTKIEPAPHDPALPTLAATELCLPNLTG